MRVRKECKFINVQKEYSDSRIVFNGWMGDQRSYSLFLCVSRSAPSYNYGINSVPFQTGRYFQAAAVVWVTHLGAKNHITVSMKSLIHLSCDRATYCMLVCV